LSNLSIPDDKGCITPLITFRCLTLRYFEYEIPVALFFIVVLFHKDEVFAKIQKTAHPDED